MQHIQAAVSAAEPAKSGGSNYTFLIILLVLLVGLFFLSRRTQKRQKDAQSFRSNLTPGQDVMTASGMLGTIVEVDGDEITIESTPGVRSRWVRAAIAKVVEPTATTEAPAVTAASDTQGDDVLEVPDDLSGLTDDGKLKDDTRPDDSGKGDGAK
ncbi:preprotein translocase subunit YajC [Luteimicrobium sp. NPDC057192]|uniref:preprotein translocase subunit YajC n=1 Tax=Luteimicrobium sp. NPDC057192 TaxID=3346042 RepID=UPI003640BC78